MENNVVEMSSLRNQIWFEGVELISELWYEGEKIDFDTMRGIKDAWNHNTNVSIELSSDIVELKENLEIDIAWLNDVLNKEVA